jgi:hypothetical protein
VGFSRERVGKDGKPRYVALYRGLKGRQRSAGTFASRRQADRLRRAHQQRTRLRRPSNLEPALVVTRRSAVPRREC